MIISPISHTPASAPLIGFPAGIEPLVSYRNANGDIQCGTFPLAPLPQAADGVAELGPIIDFPGVKTGDLYTITGDSRAGKLGSVKGNAEILRFDNDGASFHAKAGKFGFNIEAQIDVQRLDAETVRVNTTTSRAIPGLESEMIGKIVASRPNYAEFVNQADASQRMILQRDDKGVITIDTAVPTLGALHIVLAKKS